MTDSKWKKSIKTRHKRNTKKFKKFVHSLEDMNERNIENIKWFFGISDDKGHKSSDDFALDQELDCADGFDNLDFSPTSLPQEMGNIMENSSQPIISSPVSENFMVNREFENGCNGRNGVENNKPKAGKSTRMYCDEESNRNYDSSPCHQSLPAMPTNLNATLADLSSNQLNFRNKPKALHHPQAQRLVQNLEDPYIDHPPDVCSISSSTPESPVQVYPKFGQPECRVATDCENGSSSCYSDLRLGTLEEQQVNNVWTDPTGHQGDFIQTLLETHSGTQRLIQSLNEVGPRLVTEKLEYLQDLRRTLIREFESVPICEQVALCSEITQVTKFVNFIEEHRSETSKLYVRKRVNL